MQPDIAGTWKLKLWRHIDADGSVVFPLGEDPAGILIYTEDGSMAVQMLTAQRPHLDTNDPIGGDMQARAAAYSTCLAYFGTYEVNGEAVIHHVEAALFPNWSNTEQKRPYVWSGETLSLQVFGDDGQMTNEIIWTRKGSEG